MANRQTYVSTTGDRQQLVLPTQYGTTALNRSLSPWALQRNAPTHTHTHMCWSQWPQRTACATHFAKTLTTTHIHVCVASSVRTCERFAATTTTTTTTKCASYYSRLDFVLNMSEICAQIRRYDMHQRVRDIKPTEFTTAVNSCNR